MSHSEKVYEINVVINKSDGPMSRLIWGILGDMDDLSYVSGNDLSLNCKYPCLKYKYLKPREVYLVLVENWARRVYVGSVIEGMSAEKEIWASSLWLLILGANRNSKLYQMTSLIWPLSSQNSVDLIGAWQSSRGYSGGIQLTKRKQNYFNACN